MAPRQFGYADYKAELSSPTRQSDLSWFAVNQFQARLINKLLKEALRTTVSADEENPGKFCVVHGQRSFHKAEEITADFDSQSDFDSQLSIDVIKAGQDINTLEKPIDLSTDMLPSSQAKDAAAVLAAFPNAEGDELRSLVIQAEVMQFEGTQRDELLNILRQYISNNRDSRDRAELVAVASAIRKCVAMLDTADMGWLATVLDANHRVTASLDTELEIAKMIVRKYTANFPAKANPEPKLSERLAEIASEYLSPRIFSRDGYATVAMLSMQALLLMRSPQAKTVIKQVNRLPFAWFRQQLRRRMDKVIKEIRSDCAEIGNIRNLVNDIDLN